MTRGTTSDNNDNNLSQFCQIDYPLGKPLHHRSTEPARLTRTEELWEDVTCRDVHRWTLLVCPIPASFTVLRISRYALRQTASDWRERSSRRRGGRSGWLKVCARARESDLPRPCGFGLRTNRSVTLACNKSRRELCGNGLVDLRHDTIERPAPEPCCTAHAPGLCRVVICTLRSIHTGPRR